MSRRIISVRDELLIRELLGGIDGSGDQSLEQTRNASTRGRAAPPKSDDYSSRVLKLVPAEVIAVFISIDGTIRTAGETVVPASVYWFVLAALTIGTYFYITRITALPMLPNNHRQALLSAFSFLVWVFAIGGPFAYSKLDWYHPAYGAILLPLFTFALPLLIPQDK